MGELRFGRDMTEAEAMMWAIERDPWLAPSGGSITLFDRPLDFGRFRRDLERAVATIPRLRQHVVAPLAPVVAPHWEIDHELDLDWHVRHVRAPGDGSLRDLLDWTTLFLLDPYDRTRPLWQYVVIDGVEGGRGALAVKLHHVVTDGHGAVRLAGTYTTLEREVPEPDPVDLDAVLAADAPDKAGVGELAAGAMRTPLNLGKTLLDALTHPPKLLGATREAESLARTAGEQLKPGGSPLWRGRSRRRRAEAVSVPFGEARAAWKALDGTLNDFFVTAVIEAAARYHEQLGAEVEHFHTTFVVSTRQEGDGAENAFSPVPVDLPARATDLRDRFTTVRDLLHERRQQVHGQGPLAAVATLANLLPAPMVTNVARSQAANVDVATSNLPGFLGECFVAGARTEHTYVFGPVAGTACNVTLYTTAGSIDIGLHVDPVAIAEPGRLRDCLEGALADLVALGAPPRPRKKAKKGATGGRA